MNTERVITFFDVTTVDGCRVRYEKEIWQKRELLLISLAGDVPPSLTADLRARVGDAAAVVVTTETIEGFPHPGAIVADRWGEVHHVTTIDPAAPDLDDLIAWVRFVRMKCPECEGEAR